MAVGLRRRPLTGAPPLRLLLSLAPLSVFSLAWLWAAASLALELPHLLRLRGFCGAKLGLGDGDMGTVEWPELVARLVTAQAHTRLCVVRDLSAVDVCARVTRRDNVLVGLLNKGALDLRLPRWCWPVPACLGGGGGGGTEPPRRVWLTKLVEWNLRAWVVAPLFDEHCRVRPPAPGDAAALAGRLRAAAVANAAAAPFLALFMVLHFFLKHAERLYHHPARAGDRAWSAAARWAFREFNELPHVLDARLRAAAAPARAYAACFPSHALAQARPGAAGGPLPGPSFLPHHHHPTPLKLAIAHSN